MSDILIMVWTWGIAKKERKINSDAWVSNTRNRKIVSPFSCEDWQVGRKSFGIENQEFILDKLNCKREIQKYMSHKQ